MSKFYSLYIMVILLSACLKPGDKPAMRAPAPTVPNPDVTDPPTPGPPDVGDNDPLTDKPAPGGNEPSPDNGPPLTGEIKLPSFAATQCEASKPYDAKGIYEIYEPGRSAFKAESEHFVARWDAKDNVTVGADKIKSGLAGLESARKIYLEKIHFLPPYHNMSKKFKINVNLSDQGYATGSGSGDIHPEMWVNQTALDHPATLAHEMAHTFQYTSRGMRDSPYVGWSWESHANWWRKTHMLIASVVAKPSSSRHTFITAARAIAIAIGFSGST